MNCPKVKKELLPFLEGDITGKQKEEIEAHINACSGCRQEKELFIKSWQILDDYVAPDLKDDFVPSLMRKIHSGQAREIKVRYSLPQFSFSFNFKHLAPVLALCLVVVLTIYFYQRKPGIELQTAKVPRQIEQTEPKAVTEITDEEIINNLDVFVNIDLLDNLELYNDFDLVENLEV